MSIPAARRTLKMNNGLTVPQLAFGTFQTSVADIVEAIRAGVRHLDTAEFYQNETTVGEAIAQAIKEGIVKREELFITTKLWNTHHVPSDVQPALEASLRRLGVSYVDLYLIHFPVAIRNSAKDFDDFSVAMPQKEGGGADVLPDVTLLDTWRALEALVDKKLVLSIGISNYSVEEQEEVVKGSRILPAVNQVELHVALPQKALQASAAKHGILLEGYSTLGTGVGFIGAKGVIHHPRVKQIAEQNGLTAGDLLLRWVLQQNVITIFKSTNRERIHSNAALTSDPLPANAVAELEAFAAANPLRSVNQPGMRPESKDTLFFNDGLPNTYDI